MRLWHLSIVLTFVTVSSALVVYNPVTGVAGGLVNTGLVVSYPINEATSGTSPTEVLDSTASNYDLTITYNGNMTYNEVSSNSCLDSTNTSGDQRAEKAIDDSSDAIRDDIVGQQKITAEFVADIDDGASGGGRLWAFNSGTSNARFGVVCTSSTVCSFYWEGTKQRTWDPGTVRAVWHISIDTTQATANDRTKVYKDGSLQSPTVDANMAQNDTFSMGNGHFFYLFNRGEVTRNRSIDGKLFWLALYGGHTFPQADVTTNYNILKDDDDTP